MPQHREQGCLQFPDDVRPWLRFRRTRPGVRPASAGVPQPWTKMARIGGFVAALAVPRRWVRTTIGRRVLVMLLSMLCSLPTACGGKAPTHPDPSVPLPLTPGRQLLTLGGFWTSFDPMFPACTPAGQPRDGTSVSTMVTLTNEGGDWVARSVPTMGSLELRLRGTGASARGYLVTGTISGMAADIGLMGVIRDVRVSLASTSSGGFATFDGETASPSSSFVVGRVTGTVRFSDSRGESSTCAAIQWSMQPY
jgi:hypothetical protein